MTGKQKPGVARRESTTTCKVCRPKRILNRDWRCAQGTLKQQATGRFPRFATRMFQPKQT